MVSIYFLLTCEHFCSCILCMYCIHTSSAEIQISRFISIYGFFKLFLFYLSFFIMLLLISIFHYVYTYLLNSILSQTINEKYSIFVSFPVLNILITNLIFFILLLPVFLLHFNYYFQKCTFQYFCFIVCFSVSFFPIFLTGRHLILFSFIFLHKYCILLYFFKYNFISNVYYHKHILFFEKRKFNSYEYQASSINDCFDDLCF